MTRLGTLVHAGLKSNFGLAVLWHRIFREKKDRWVVPMIALSLLGIFPMVSGIIVVIREAYFALKPLGQERALLNAGFLAGQTVVFVFGIYYVISALYFSRDLEMLIPLPLRPSEVMISKFTVIAINEYLTIAIVVLPVVVTYGVLAGSGPGYWVHAVLAYLALPVIPLAIVSVLVIAMMRATNISRKKDALIIVGSVAVLAAVMGFQYMMQRAGSQTIRTQDLASLLESPDSLLMRIGAWFPPSIWATKAVAGGFSPEGFLHLFLLLGSSLLVFGALVMLAERLFYGGVIGLSEISLRKRRLSRAEMSRSISSGRHAIQAIFTREWRIMNRTPVFLMNGVIVVLLFPVLIVLMSRTGSAPLADLTSKMQASGHSAPILLIIALFMVVCGTLNGVSSSAFSREGVQFWISQVIPVAPREQAAAKFLHCYLISLLGIAAASVVAVVLLHPGAALLIAAAGLALVTNALLTSIGMMIDLARPLLDWTNPQKAIKQNLNVLLATLADVGILTLAFFGVRFLIKTRLADAAIVGASSTAMAMLAALSYWALLRFAEKRYREIEA